MNFPSLGCRKRALMRFERQASRKLNVSLIGVFVVATARFSPAANEVHGATQDKGLDTVMCACNHDQLLGEERLSAAAKANDWAAMC